MCSLRPIPLFTFLALALISRRVAGEVKCELNRAVIDGKTIHYCSWS